jgi:hypothetical protein
MIVKLPTVKKLFRLADNTAKAEKFVIRRNAVITKLIFEFDIAMTANNHGRTMIVSNTDLSGTMLMTDGGIIFYDRRHFHQASSGALVEKCRYEYELDEKITNEDGSVYVNLKANLGQTSNVIVRIKSEYDNSE